MKSISLICILNLRYQYYRVKWRWQFDVCPRAQGRSLDKMHITELKFKAVQSHRLPRISVLMERKGLQHSEFWKKRRASGKDWKEQSMR